MFRRALHLSLVATLLSAVAMAGSDPFIGRWKLNPSKSTVVDQMKVESLGGNKYGFDFGGGPEEIVADGTDQQGKNDSTLSVAVEGPYTWKVVRKQNGRVLITATWTISQDGSTLTDDFTVIDSSGAKRNTKFHYKRITEGSGFAATWVSAGEMISAFVLEVKPYEMEGLSFIFVSQEQTTNVKFDGKDYPRAGRNATAGFTSSARRLSTVMIEITDKMNGKTVVEQKAEVSSDLKTLTMIRQVVGQSKPSTLVFERQ